MPGIAWYCLAAQAITACINHEEYTTKHQSGLQPDAKHIRPHLLGIQSNREITDIARHISRNSGVIVTASYDVNDAAFKYG